MACNQLLGTLRLRACGAQFILSNYTNFVLLWGRLNSIATMKNVTITLDSKTAAWARVYAARQNVSLSRFVGELLRERMRESREYDEAMRRYLAKGPFKKLRGPGERYPSRDELHDRAGLR